MVIMSTPKSNTEESSENAGKSDKFVDLTQDQIIEIELAKKQIEKKHTFTLKEVDERVKLWLN